MNKPSTILITGGAGFIGSHLVERLLPKYRVICVDNFDPFYDEAAKRRNLDSPLAHDNYTLLVGDIRDLEFLQSIFAEHQVDGVIHLAARPGTRASEDKSLIYTDINVTGTVNLLEVCKGIDLKTFIFGSSSSVYGANQDIPFAETSATDTPLCPYAATKKAGELLCYTYHHLHQMPITCLRFFSVYGPRLRPDLAMYKFARKIDRGEELPVYGDGTSQRDYTYISDIIDGVVAALEHPSDYEIINLGDAHPVELRYVINLLEENIGKKAKLKYLPEKPSDVPVTYANINKARQLLGYQPKVTIEDGIAEFVRWYKNTR